MKMIFRGWGKERIGPHVHVVRPVKKNKSGDYNADKTDGPLRWVDSLKARGQVVGLGLSGNFLVEFDFEQEELKNWLQRFVKAEPEAALKLMAEMHTEAILALSRKPGEKK